MHFGEFNPLEVLATAAIQREGNVTEGNIESNATSNDSEPNENGDDCTEDTVSTDIAGNGSASKSNCGEEKAETPQQEISNAVAINDLKVINSTTSTNSKSEFGAPSYVIKMVTSNGNKVTTAKSVMTLKDATKIYIPNKDGSSKTLTVLKINKALGSKSSVATTVVGEKPKGDEDEGYCSRSSLDSPGQCSRSDSESCEVDTSDIKSPTPTTFSASSNKKGLASKTESKISELKPFHSENKVHLQPSPKEPSKSSANINPDKNQSMLHKKENSRQNDHFCKPLDPCQNSKGAVLRSLLGEKVAVQISPQGHDSQMLLSPKIGQKMSPRIAAAIPVSDSKSCETSSLSRSCFPDLQNSSISSEGQSKNESTKFIAGCENSQVTVQGKKEVNNTKELVEQSQSDCEEKKHLEETDFSVKLKDEENCINTPNSGESKNENSKVLLQKCPNEASKSASSEVLSEESGNDGTQGESNNTQLTPSESFQNAFKSFLTSGKPEVAEVKNCVVVSKNDGSSFVLSTSAQGTNISVGGPASQLVTSIASHVLASSQQVAQSRSHLNETANENPAKVDGKIGSLMKESLKPKVNTQMAVNVSKEKCSTVTKTIPVLISIANGKKIANVPVTSLASSSTAVPIQKPVTYLVMPPQNSKGTSLLLPSQSQKSHGSTHSRYQYIIQDDVPPVVSGELSQVSGVNVVNMTKSTLASKTNDTWTLLASVDPQGVITNTSQAFSKSKTVPVLIKKPLSGASVIPENSLLKVTSKQPQSLIPKLRAPSLTRNSSSINQANILVNPNDVLCSQEGKPVHTKDTILNLSQVGFVTNSKVQHNNVKLVQSDIDASQNCQSELVNEVTAIHKLDCKGEGLGAPDTSGRVTPFRSLETSPIDTINVKITGNKVVDLNTSEESPFSTKKQTRNIGKFGALSSSWNGFQKSESSPSFGTSLTTSRVSSPVLLYDSATTSPSSSVEPWSPNPMSPLQIKSDSELDVELATRPRIKGCPMGSTRSGHNYFKRKLRASTSSTPDLTVSKDNSHVTPRLHPLIDHDYCMFSEFSADIQSSIIATTESKKKIERYNQKAKAARTKQSLFKLDKNCLKSKKRKYTHHLSVDELRKTKPEKQHLIKKLEVPSAVLSDLHPLSMSRISKSEKSSSKKQTALDKKLLKSRISTRRDGRNYVKITGSFQDDFVYYATKNSRGRPRKYHDSTTPKSSSVLASSKKTPVGGINVFDWYRDLSKTDKNTKFGIQDTSPVTKEVVNDPNVNGIDDRLNIPTSQKGGHTPVHESEVADLVMQMMPNADFSTASGFEISANASVGQSETVTTSLEKENEKSNLTGDTIQPVADCPPATEQPVDLNDMAEQVRSMLNSLGEAELNLLSEKIGNGELSNTQTNEELSKSESQTEHPPESSSETRTSTTDTSDYSGLNVFLGPYGQDGNSAISQTANASFDLDDINDSDLLPSDIGNINTLLGDLGTNRPSEAKSTIEVKDNSPILDTPSKQNVPLNMLFGDCHETPDKHTEKIGTVKSNQSSCTKAYKSEHIATSSANIVDAPQEVVVQHPPELTVVSMFWNDLPGLMINGKQCVRLVDIHKQMLPAKDTGILKKRCQMMNLFIMNCSELERDFLIRYANAAKSKSCVVVGKDDAQALVSFYVNPRPRISSLARQSTGDSWDSNTEMDQFGIDGIATDMKPTSDSAINTRNGERKELSSSVSNSQTSGKGKGKGSGKSSHKRKASPSLSVPSSVTISSSSGTDTTIPEFTITKDSEVFNNQETDPNSLKRSERTRNRKINYAALNSGMYSDENPELNSSQDTSVEEFANEEQSTENISNKSTVCSSASDSKLINNNSKTIKVCSYLLNQVVLVKNSPVLKADSILNVNVAEMNDSSIENRYNFQEEIEIRRLRNKQKRGGLNNVDKRKLKRLRERLRVKVRNLKRKLDSLKKNNGLAMSPEKILVKSMRGFQDQKLSEQPECDEVLEEANRDQTVPEVNTTTENKSLQSVDLDLPTTEIKDQSDFRHELPYNPKVQTDLEKPQDKSDIELKECNQSLLPANKTDKQPKRAKSVKNPKKKIVFPVLHRSSQRGRVQVGNLHFHLYKAKDSSCIQCATCSDFLSVKKFLKHLHHHNMVDELCTVTIPQKLEMAVLGEPSEEHVYWWGQFEKKRKLFEFSPTMVKGTQKSNKTSVNPKVIVHPVTQADHSETESISVNNNNKSSVCQESSTPTSCTSVSGTRHSQRVRKRKQLHPIESYVYTNKNTHSDSKHAKYSDALMQSVPAKVKMELHSKTHHAELVPLVERISTVGAFNSSHGTSVNIG